MFLYIDIVLTIQNKMKWQVRFHFTCQFIFCFLLHSILNEKVAGARYSRHLTLIVGIATSSAAVTTIRLYIFFFISLCFGISSFYLCQEFFFTIKYTNTKAVPLKSKRNKIYENFYRKCLKLFFVQHAYILSLSLSLTHSLTVSLTAMFEHVDIRSR